jgi:hypothetical protein
MPTTLWRGTFRFWLSVLAADHDTRRGVRRLLVAYDDACTTTPIGLSIKRQSGTTTAFTSSTD